MSASPKMRVTCATCGAATILRDAYAEWNEETQGWEIAQLFDDAWCWNCSEDASYNQEPIEKSDSTPKAGPANAPANQPKE